MTKVLSNRHFLNEVPVEGGVTKPSNHTLGRYNHYTAQIIESGNCITLLTGKVYLNFIRHKKCQVLYLPTVAAFAEIAVCILLINCSTSCLYSSSDLFSLDGHANAKVSASEGEYS